MQILGGAKIDAQVAISTAEHCLHGETAEVSHKDPYLIHVELELRAF